MNNTKRKKSIFTLFLALSLLLCLAGALAALSAPERAAYAETGQTNTTAFTPTKFTTTFSNNGYIITGFDTNDGAWTSATADQKQNIAIVIPAVYNDSTNDVHPVVAIGDSAFDMLSKGGTGKIYNGCVFTSLNLSNASNLTTIGHSAFRNCSGLTGALTIPNTVTTIENYSFYGCNGLTGALTIPNSVTAIGNRAFYNCNGFNDKLTLPSNNNFTKIDGFAFSGCSGLTGALTIPKSVTTIGESAFYGCSKLSGALTIPNSVTTIGESAFRDCRSFNGSLTLPINDDFTTIGENTFRNCGGLTGALTIPNSVTTIGNAAFRDCSSFNRSLTLPTNDGFTTIESSAFDGCSGLTGALTIPNSVTTIGNYAFRFCSALTGALTIPNSVTTIGNSAFYGCKGFNDKLTLPTNDGFTTIGNFSFYGCSGLTGGLTIPNSVTTIGNNAFENCSGLTGALTIPNIVTTIGDFAFYGCKGFNDKLTLPTNDGFTTIGNFTFYECSGLTGALTIPNTVTTVGNHAFNGCSQLSGALIIPNSVTTIGDSAFYGCKGFQDKLTLPMNEGFTTIGKSAFESCNGLTGALTIPNSVTTIGNYAFYNCSGFQTVYLPNATSEMTYGVDVFSDVTCPIVTTQSLHNQYKADSAHALYNLSNLTYEMTVTFDANGGMVAGTVTQTKLFNLSYRFEKKADGVWAVNDAYALPLAVKNDYALAGWNTKSDGSGNALGAISAATYYAQYSEFLSSLRISGTPDKSMYIAFDSFDPKGLTIDAIYRSGSEKTLSANEFTVNYAGGNASFRYGETYVTILYTENDITKTATVEGISVNKMRLSKPWIEGTYAYTGKQQTVTLANFNDELTVSNNTRIDAGKQNVTVTLKDPDNYMWSDNTTDALIIEWEILKVALTPGVSGIMSKTYDGSIDATGTISLSGAVNGEQPTATGTFVWTSADAGTTIVNVTGITLGERWKTNYELSANLLSNQSYGAAKINAATITNNGAFTDCGEIYDKTAHAIGYDSSKISVVNARTVTVYYSEDGTNGWKTDPITFTDFTDGAKTVYWKVSASNHTDITGSNTVTITAKGITVTANEKNSIHKADLAALTYVVSPALYEGDAFTGALATNADKATVGAYDITLGTLSAGNNYAITFVGARYDVIAKATVTITQTAQHFTYDGSEKAFAVSGTQLGGFTVEYFVSGAYTGTPPTGAGSYNVKVTRSEDANTYAFAVEITDGLVIAAQKVAKPTANTDTFTYTGQAQTYTLTSDNRYVIANATRTDAGSQTVTVALHDKANYEWTGGGTDDVTFIFAIGKGAAQITVDDTAIVGTYGDIWSLPSASSNFGTVECDLSVEEMTAAGSYTVTFTVRETDNYDGDSKQISVTIKKQKVAIPDADATIFVADGTQKIYRIAEDARYTVNGNTATDAGNYTVTVFLNDADNYEWTDGTTTEWNYAFTVRKPEIAEKIDENSEKEHIIVSADNGFAPEVAIEVTAVAELTQAREAVAKSEKVSAIYDVKLLIDGIRTQPDGTITIRFLIPDECVGTAFRLLHIHNGEAIETDYTIEGDYAVVTTDKLSEFVFVIDNTGSVLWVIILLAVLLTAEIALAAIKLRKNKKGKTVRTYALAHLLLAVFIPVDQVTAAAVLGAMCAAGAIFDAYLYFGKKGRPQQEDLPAQATLETPSVPVCNDRTEIYESTETRTGRAVAITIRYKRSFTAKLIQSPDETKSYYGQLKNALQSYKKTASRVSWNYDSINCGRTKLAKFVIKGKTLFLFLALDPESFVGTKYKAQRAENKRYADVPCLYKIKNGRRAKYALDLIAALAEKFGLVKGEEQHKNYFMPYETTEALIAKGLIKELITEEEYQHRRFKRDRTATGEGKRSVISAREADRILSDEAAAALVTEKKSIVPYGKKEKRIVNIDAISDHFAADELVKLQSLKDKGLLDKKANYFKVLARGSLDKPLTVEANEFSMEAVKMIVLTGGKAIKLRQ